MDNFSQNERILKDLHKDLEILFHKVTGKTYLKFGEALDDIISRSHERKIFQRIAREDTHIRALNRVRNIFSHGNYDILIPDKTIMELETLRDSLTLKSKDLFAVNVYSCIDDMNLSDVLKEMELKTYTHVPIYSRLDGTFMGVLTESDITFWLMNELQRNDILIEKNNLKIKDIPRNNGGNNSYIFLRSDTPIFEIESFFDSYIKENRRLGAIFLTNLGKESEKIEGTVTAWDLPKIANSIYE